MARKFSYPDVAALELDSSCVVYAPVSEVKRKCALYGGRNDKRFIVRNDNAAPDDCPPRAIVTRPPITDTELPGVG